LSIGTIGFNDKVTDGIEKKCRSNNAFE